MLIDNRRLRLEDAIEFVALLIDVRLGGVDILGESPLEVTTSESDDFAGIVENREDDTAAETVVISPLLLCADESQLGEDLEAETGLASGIGQSRAFVEGITEVERLDCLIGDATLHEILQTDISPLVGLEHILLHLLHRPLIGDKHSLASRLSLTLLIGEFALHDFDAILFGEVEKSLMIIEALLLHDEIDGGATLLAGEAIAEISLAIDRERGSPLIVERAESHIVGAPSDQVHIVADDIDDIGSIFDFFDGSMIDHRA